MRFAGLLLALAACTLSVSAQIGGTRPVQPPAAPAAPSTETALGSIRGKVVLENGALISQAVRITLQSLRGTEATLYSDNQGQFEIGSLPPGNYTLEIEGDRLRFEVTSERIEVRKGIPSIVTLALKEKRTSDATRPAEGVISVTEVSKDVPAKARKEFERAGKFAKEGKALEAIEHLRKAIEIYPNFMMAHNDLGAQLLEQGRLDEAAAEAQLAIGLDAKAFNPHLNLGIILLRQHKFSEAAEILREALSLESNSPAAKLYLGQALMGLHDLEGAERELRAAHDLGGATYALALFYLGEVYMDRGERALARQALEAYLREVPNAENAAQARKMVGMLQ